MKQHILAEEEKGRGEKEGRRSNVALRPFTARERNKGGKTDCVFKFLASGEAPVTTRESFSSAAALQPSVLSTIRLSFCFGPLGGEKQPGEVGGNFKIQMLGV